MHFIVSAKKSFSLCAKKRFFLVFFFRHFDLANVCSLFFGTFLVSRSSSCGFVAPDPCVLFKGCLSLLAVPSQHVLSLQRDQLLRLPRRLRRHCQSGPGHFFKPHPPTPPPPRVQQPAPFFQLAAPGRAAGTPSQIENKSSTLAKKKSPPQLDLGVF